MKSLCERLGRDYCIRTIDLEPVIYRDFGNGYNVEISGVYTTGTKKKATLYLWYGERQPECIIVKKVSNVAREDIGTEVDKLFEYSKELLSKGLDSRDKIFRYKFKVWNMAKGGAGMNRKIFYGSNPSFTDKDKSCFSRGEYECKALLKNKDGMPVVISQRTDKDCPICKVEYGFSCLIFPSVELAMEYCESRFQSTKRREG
jgi:hypothetical protein